jgi:hypothetical protein
MNSKQIEKIILAKFEEREGYDTEFIIHEAAQAVAEAIQPPDAGLVEVPRVCGNCLHYREDWTSVGSVTRRCAAPEEINAPPSVVGYFFGAKNTAPNMSAETCPAWGNMLQAAQGGKGGGG